MKVLVVDDEQLARWYLDRAFRKKGHPVMTAENVEDAKVKLSSEAVDVLITDIRMPGEDGTVLIGKVDIRGKKPRVIVCSAFITAELEEKFRQDDVCVLRKPIKLDELNEAVRICQKKDQRGERREQVIGDLLWCREVAPNNYKCGLFVTKYY